MAELFRNFEVNRDLRWQLILKLIGGSLVAHVLAIACVAYIPGLRDAFNIAVLLGDASFVDKAYERTEIGGDDVQMVELSSGKFRYPDGYWAPEGQLGIDAAPALSAAQIIAQTNPGYRGYTPPPSQSAPTPDLNVAPTPLPVASPSPLPGSVTSPSPAETVAKAKASPSPPKTDEKLTPEQAQAALEASAKKNNIELPKEGEINKQPLKDVAIEAMKLKNLGKLDLDQPFEIVIEAELDEHGKLKNPKFTRTAGDPVLVELSGRMIAALNDSGFLIYLKRINEDNPGTKVIFTVKQDQSEIMATVESDTSSVSSAGRLSKAFNILLAAGAKSREGKDEEMLLKNTTASQDGKKIKFHLTMPRQPVVDLIKKQLPS
ncbi:MAG: hypothetical protein H7Z16_18095 [Pyrinomonadaceae bacterium]|nr:hypothetical protein [Pyrinomonadaceae bacterium]